MVFFLPCSQTIESLGGQEVLLHIIITAASVLFCWRYVTHLWGAFNFGVLSGSCLHTPFLHKAKTGRVKRLLNPWLSRDNEQWDNCTKLDIAWQVEVRPAKAKVLLLLESRQRVTSQTMVFPRVNILPHSAWNWTTCFFWLYYLLPPNSKFTER